MFFANVSNLHIPVIRERNGKNNGFAVGTSFSLPHIALHTLTPRSTCAHTFSLPFPFLVLDTQGSINQFDLKKKYVGTTRAAHM